MASRKILRDWKFLVPVLACVAAAAIWVGAYSLPDSWDLQRSELIEASVESVYARVQDPKIWLEWGPWCKDCDPKAEILFEGQSSGEGAVVKWRGPRSGQGVMTFLEAQPGKGLWYEMRLGSSRVRQVRGSFVLTPVEGGTQITWTQSEEASANPLSRYRSLIAEKIQGSRMEESLRRLKTLTEDL